VRYYLADRGTDLRTMQDYLGHRDLSTLRITLGSRAGGSRGFGARKGPAVCQAGYATSAAVAGVPVLRIQQHTCTRRGDGQ
jgi:hypothetical protein